MESRDSELSNGTPLFEFFLNFFFFFLKFSWPREVISRFQYKYRPVPRPIETFYRVLPLRFLNLIPPTVVWYWTSPLQSTSLFENTVRYSIYISAPYGIRTGALFVFRRMYRYASMMSYRANHSVEI